MGHDAEVAAWVGEKIGSPISPPYTALGWIDDSGALSAGFVFYGYSGSNVDLAIAASGRFTRGMISAVANYVFGQIECRRATARTARKNERACSILRRIGFRQETICKHYYQDDDAVQFRLLRRDARKWL